MANSLAKHKFRHFHGLDIARWLFRDRFAIPSQNYFGRTKRKHVFGHMRTAKAQISLRIRAVWSGPSLSANRIIEYYRMYQWTAKTRIRPCARAEWCYSAQFAHARRHLFAWRGPFDKILIHFDIELHEHQHDNQSHLEPEVMRLQ